MSAHEKNEAGNSTVIVRRGVPQVKRIMHRFSYWMPKNDGHLFLTLIQNEVLAIHLISVNEIRDAEVV